MYTGAHSAKTVLIIFRKKALNIFHKMDRQYDNKKVKDFAHFSKNRNNTYKRSENAKYEQPHY